MTREEQLKADYEAKLTALRKEQCSCSHVWEPAKYDPEITPVPKFEDHWQGVDCFPVICGWKEKKTDRWSLTCCKCVKVEYTKELVAVATTPKFN